MQCYELENRIIATKDDDLLLKFYMITHQEEKAEKIARGFFEKCLEKEKYPEAINFGKKFDCLKEDVAVLCAKRYKMHMEKGNFLVALEIAKVKENGFSAEHILIAAKKSFEDILEKKGNHCKLMDLAENELKNEPEYLKKAVKISFEIKLKSHCFLELKNLTEKYPDFFDQIDIELAKFFIINKVDPMKIIN